jgi:hypothetical protein
MKLISRGHCLSGILLSLLRVSMLLAALAMLAGCATTTANHEQMTPLTFEPGIKHQKTVGVSVGGGKEQGDLGRTPISNAEFQKALIDSISKSQTFSQVVEGNNGDYLLTVVIFSLDQPAIGFSFTVRMEAGWTLKRAATGEIVWQEALKSEHTATPGDAFAAVTRLRLATEGAARNNISQGLAKISKLNL